MRLTEECKYDNFDYCYAKSNKEQDNDILVLNKLGQLEDVLEKYNIDSPELLDKDLEICHRLVYEYGQIKEELGIDLITLFKALTQGIWFEDDKTHHFVSLDRNNLGDFRLSYCIVDDLYNGVYTKDYGKTWALTKEELL